MASPQIEEGYTRIAHQLLDGIVASALTALELRIVLFVARKTYGARGSPKVASLSSREIAVAVRTNNRHAARTVKDLVKRRVLVEESPPSFHAARRFGIQKDFESWTGAAAPEGLYGATLAPQGRTTLASQRHTTLASQRQSDVLENHSSSGSPVAGDNYETTTETTTSPPPPAGGMVVLSASSLLDAVDPAGALARAKRAKSARCDPDTVPIPNDLAAHESILRRWLRHKQERREGFLPTGIESLWARARKLGDDLPAAVEHSLSGNYAGLFEPKGVSRAPPDGETNRKAAIRASIEKANQKGANP